MHLDETNTNLMDRTIPYVKYLKYTSRWEKNPAEHIEDLFSSKTYFLGLYDYASFRKTNLTLTRI